MSSGLGTHCPYIYLIMLSAAPDVVMAIVSLSRVRKVRIVFILIGLVAGLGNPLAFVEVSVALRTQHVLQHCLYQRQQFGPLT